MDVSSNNSIVISENHVVFSNLVSPGQAVGSRNVVTAELQQPSPVINQPNAAGVLRQVKDLHDIAALGAEAAGDFLEIIK